jgi:lipoate-protein ligase A
MLQPVADAYRDLGVPARFRPVNDIVTEDGRKISGNGAATIEDYVILVGNLIADFDYDTMVRVLRVPDEKFRDKVFKTMRENLTTLQRETGRLPTWNEMAGALIHNLEKVLGPLNEAPLPQSVYDKAESLKQQFLSEDWLLKNRRTVQGRDVKIADGVNVVQRVYKAPGGLLRATLELHGDDFGEVSLSGDFFCYPASAVARLETALNGVSLSQVRQVLSDFYAETGTETPGVTVDDWLKVLVP